MGRPVQTTTDTSEKGLERLICTAMTGAAPADGRGLAETPAAYGGPGWVEGAPQDYDREHAVDLVQLSAFLRATQPEVAEALALAEDGPTRRSFLARLQGEVTKRGTIDVLRSGVRHRQYQLDLFYGTPSPGNPAAAARYALQPLHDHPAAPLQPRRDAAGARPRQRSSTGCRCSASN